jgi:hypothetical protein
LIPIYQFNDTSEDSNVFKQYQQVAEILSRKVKGSKSLSDKYTQFFQNRYFDVPKCGVSLNFNTPNSSFIIYF